MGWSYLGAGFNFPARRLDRSLRRLSYSRARNPWRRALILFRRLDHCQSAHRIFGGASVPRPLLTTLADGIGFWAAAILLSISFGALHYFPETARALGRIGLHQPARPIRVPHAAPHWLTAFAIGFHAAFDFANLFVWSGQNAGDMPSATFLKLAGKGRNGSPAACWARKRAGWYLW